MTAVIGQGIWLNVHKINKKSVFIQYFIRVIPIKFACAKNLHYYYTNNVFEQVYNTYKGYKCIGILQRYHCIKFLSRW